MLQENTAFVLLHTIHRIKNKYEKAIEHTGKCIGPGTDSTR